MKKIIALTVLWLFLAPALAQNTLEQWLASDKAFAWDAPDGPAPKGYNLYKSLVSGGPYTKVNTDLITRLTFNDPAAVEGQFFVVSAVNSIDLEGLSEELLVEDQAGPRQFRFVIEGTITVIP